MEKKAGQTKKGVGVQRMLVLLEVGGTIITPDGAHTIVSLNRENGEAVVGLPNWNARIPQKYLHEHFTEMAKLFGERAGELSEKEIAALVQKAEESLDQVTHVAGTVLDEAAAGLARMAVTLKKRSKKSK